MWLLCDKIDFVLRIIQKISAIVVRYFFVWIIQKIMKLQKISAKVGAKNEQTNNSKYRVKTKQKYYNKTNKATHYHMIIIIII